MLKYHENCLSYWYFHSWYHGTTKETHSDPIQSKLWNPWTNLGTLIKTLQNWPAVFYRSVEEFTTFSVPDKPFNWTHINNIYERAVHHKNSCLWRRASAWTRTHSSFWQTHGITSQWEAWRRSCRAAPSDAGMRPLCCSARNASRCASALFP